jgi:hypothetical protein
LALQNQERGLGDIKGDITTADGAVSDRDPTKAVRTALAQRSFDEIILSTLPPSVSRWLACDL